MFAQPPLPIKCAGAPQKAMHLSCDHWQHHGRLRAIDVAFHNPGVALFDGQKPQRLSWWLKSEAPSFIYWTGMSKGREWLAASNTRSVANGG